MPDTGTNDVAALKAAEERAYLVCDEATTLIQDLYRLVTLAKQDPDRPRYRRVFDKAVNRGDRRHQAWRRAWIAFEDKKREIAGHSRPRTKENAETAETAETMEEHHGHRND